MFIIFHSSFAFLPLAFQVDLPVQSLFSSHFTPRPTYWPPSSLPWFHLPPSSPFPNARLIFPNYSNTPVPQSDAFHGSYFLSDKQLNAFFYSSKSSILKLRTDDVIQNIRIYKILFTCSPFLVPGTSALGNNSYGPYLETKSTETRHLPMGTVLMDKGGQNQS